MAKPPDPIDARLQASIRRKLAEIERLQQQVRTERRRLATLQRTGAANEPAARASSALRIAVEYLVLDRLRQNDPGITPTAQLRLLLRPIGVTSASTFRSHLRRMKEKGLIQSPSRGAWALALDVPRERIHNARMEAELARIQLAYEQGRSL